MALDFFNRPSIETSGSLTNGCLIKTDSLGDHEWSNVFGGSAIEAIRNSDNLRQTADGGYILLGMTQSFGAGGYDYYLIKTDQNGQHMWSKTIGGADTDMGGAITIANDGGFVIVGQTRSFGLGVPT